MMEGFLSEEGLEERTPLADLPANWLEEGEGNVREGEGTLTIRRENSTEIRQAGRDSRTRGQTGQDEIFRNHFEAYISRSCSKKALSRF